jgi:dipeptide/tripeptide permease
MMINIGGLIGPLVASELREISWQYMFLMSSSAIVLNMIIVLIFYKEPDSIESTGSLKESLAEVFRNIHIALKDVKFTLFLAIIILGWTVYWQFFFSLPVYIEQWIDTSVITNTVKNIFPGLAEAISSGEGQILPEKLIVLDALFIVAFQVLLSSLVMRFKPINTMIAGFLVNAIGITLAMLTRNGWFLVLSIFIFSLGEMSFSPKVLEYIGRLAPRDKAALYMGTNFLPMALGNFFAGLISGRLYEVTADKYVLLDREVRNWGLSLPEISETFSLSDYMALAAEKMGMDVVSLTDYLWVEHNPPVYGVILLILGVLCSTLLIVYDKIIFRYR